VLLTGADVVKVKNPNYPAGPGVLEIQRIMELQGTLEEGTFAFMDPVTENPKLGATEMFARLSFQLEVGETWFQRAKPRIPE
jgi:hypothetical protein